MTPGGLFIVHLTSTCNYGIPIQHSTYQRNIQGNKVYETITRGQKVRKNEHTFYLEPISDIVSMAQQIGFTVVSSEKYKNDMFYIFKKPE